MSVRALATAIGGIVVVVVLFGVLLSMIIRADSAQGEVLAAGGWVIPLLAGVITGAVTWLFIGDESKTPSGTSANQRTVPCSHCERDILANWKLCPYCGQFLERDACAGPQV